MYRDNVVIFLSVAHKPEFLNPRLIVCTLLAKMPESSVTPGI